MILVEKLKLIFIGIPYSASTAISKDLYENYSGKAILRKHSLYSEFKGISTKKEMEYLVFAIKRNPMDIVISFYEKMKNNSKGNFENLELLKKNGGHISNNQIKQFLYIKNSNASFQQYFKKFYKVPFSSLLSISKNDYDRILCFENLENDYRRLLEERGVKKSQRIKKLNQTKGKKDFNFYYNNEIRSQAINVFAPYMKEFGYEFPKEWGVIRMPLKSKIIYRILIFIKKIIYPFRSKIKRKSIMESEYGKIQRRNR